MFLVLFMCMYLKKRIMNEMHNFYGPTKEVVEEVHNPTDTNRVET